MAAQDATQQLHQQSFSQTGHALDQHVATGKQGDQRLTNELGLADIDLADLGKDRIDRRLNALKILGLDGFSVSRLIQDLFPCGSSIVI